MVGILEEADLKFVRKDESGRRMEVCFAIDFSSGLRFKSLGIAPNAFRFKFQARLAHSLIVYLV